MVKSKKYVNVQCSFKFRNKKTLNDVVFDKLFKIHFKAKPCTCDGGAIGVEIVCSVSTSTQFKCIKATQMNEGNRSNKSTY